MLAIKKQEGDRVFVHLRGPLNADLMQAGLEDLIEAAEDLANGTMLYVIDDFEWPTAGALAVEFKMMPNLLKLLGKFRKCAVLCDSGWIRKVAEIEGMLIPGLEIKSFVSKDREAAENWLKQA
ncbi:MULTISPECIES: STAS/SEC14 domain-containing protein [unclassified Roseibium]|uniref:STAS/SEC14 domain-containing protein n=1 Tax=unclassified Roseibium TaxID=2629323 RepID=UPI00273F83EA|nr:MULTISPECIES: STAS/SEC14 domain-containing protein [unclassified Roseibium]